MSLSVRPTEREHSKQIVWAVYRGEKWLADFREERPANAYALQLRKAIRRVTGK